VLAELKREMGPIASERIRDKISASKRKGLWVRGMARSVTTDLVHLALWLLTCSFNLAWTPSNKSWSYRRFSPPVEMCFVVKDKRRTKTGVCLFRG
jgi:hypothetical protein